MPKLQKAPQNGVLPFAPEGGVFWMTQQAVQVLGQGETWSVGYSFQFPPNDEAEAHKLNWVVTSRLFRVDKFGSIISVGDTSVERFGHIKADKLFRSRIRFRIKSHPALYKLKVVFKTQSGQSLVSYGSYLRTMKPRYEARLVIHGRSFHRGEHVFLQLENRGTTSVSYTDDYLVQRFSGGEWSHYPGIAPRGVRRAYFPLFAGRLSPCQAFEIPRKAPLGRYRIQKQLFLTSGSEDVRTEMVAYDFWVHRTIQDKTLD